MAGITLYTAALLSVGIPAALVSATPARTGSLWILAASVLVLAGARLSWLVGRGAPRLFEAMLWTFVYVFLGVAPLLQTRLWISPDTTPGMHLPSVAPALWIVLVGCAAAVAGMWRANRSPTSRQSAPSRVSARRVQLLTATTLAFVAYAVATLGLDVFFESRDALSRARLSTWPSAVAAIVTGASFALPLVTVHALVRLRRQRRSEGQRAGLLLTTSGMTLVLLGSVNIISSPRVTFGTALLSLAVLAGALATPRRTRLLMVAVIAGFLLVFPLADAYRYGDGEVTATTLQGIAGSGDFDAFAQVTNAVLYVDREGHTFGKQAVGVPLFWVPRAVWPDKPIDTGTLLAEYRGYPFTNLSAPLWAEAYIDFGWLGVVVALFAVGFWVRRGDRRLAVNLAATGSPSLTGAVVPFYMMMVLRGSLLQAASGLAVLLTTIWFVRDGTTLPRRRRTRGETSDRMGLPHGK